MMSELFDEEYLRQQYYIAERRKSFEEGKAVGVAEGIAEVEAEAEVIRTIAQNLREMGFSEEQILEATSI